ncbi:hypothetical protein LTR96_003441 [Exophiala xenobiotica]|nr:hypothetical protein LTR96_003441 [Exophiala xenobiotica]KAK5342852.1 hypothetical protein LTR98_000478 [Exophiala xenobiotica]
MDSSFNDKVYAISGGASGIGLAVAKALLRLGAKVSIGDIRFPDTLLAELGQEASHTKGTGNAEDVILLKKVDVRSREDVDGWIDETVAKFSALDGAANMAGTIPKDHNVGTIETVDDEDWDFVFAVNVTGMKNCLRAQLKYIGKNGRTGGSVVNAGSGLSLEGRGGTSAYTASKHAALGLTRCVAKERAVWRASGALPTTATTLCRPRRYSAHAPSPEQSKTALSSRWLSDTKARVGKCITFGMSDSLVDKAGRILRVLGHDWRAIVAGSEGYLTDPKRAGLHRHNIVWGEQDSMGHVNNVMYVRYAESGRCNTMRNFAKYVDPGHRQKWEDMLTNRGIGLILKSITVDFKFPMTWPDRVSVYHKLRSCPDEKTTSLILDVLILSENRQRPAARCLEDVVVYDYKLGKKSVMEPFMVEELRKTFELQEAAKRENHAKVQRIEEQVRHLEKQSWDRPDAKEDLGSASQL